MGNDVVAYATHHAMCQSCHDAMLRRQWWGKLLYYVGLICVMIGIPGALMLVLLLTKVVPREHYDQMFGGHAHAGVIGFAIAPFALWYARRFQRAPFAATATSPPFSPVPETTIAANWVRR
jgi:hypothetical protein